MFVKIIFSIKFQGSLFKFTSFQIIKLKSFVLARDFYFLINVLLFSIIFHSSMLQLNFIFWLPCFEHVKGSHNILFVHYVQDSLCG